jgi:hypothetical protein
MLVPILTGQESLSDMAGEHMLVLAMAALAAVTVFQKESPRQAALLQLPGDILLSADKCIGFEFN